MLYLPDSFLRDYHFLRQKKVGFYVIKILSHFHLKVTKL